MAGFRIVERRQAGMVLLISLVFLLLLSLIALSSMQGAVSQQKVVGSVWHRNQSLQSAESGLRLGEAAVRRAGAAWPVCAAIITCAPPRESSSVIAPGTDPVSRVNWAAMDGGLYAVQALGPVVGLAHLPAQMPAMLYRVTAVGLRGQSRTVLEAMYARVDEGGRSRFQRVMWRQLY
jgi:type IV pilus assembly protein PilX